MKKYLKFPAWLRLWLPLAALSWVPVLAAWRLNSFQNTLEDLLLPLVLNTLLALLITLVFYRSYRRNQLGGYLAGIFSILLLGTTYETRLGNLTGIITALNPIPTTQFDTLLISLFFILVVLLLSQWLGVKLAAWKELDLAGGLTMLISVVFLLQLLPTAWIISKEWPQFFYRPPAFDQTLKATADKPDVYYIVLDRYTSQDVLKAQFNFDNSSFINYLQSNSFTVNPDAHQNYPYTTMSIASTLDANYLGDMVQKFANANFQTVEPYHDSIRYAPVIQQFKSLGYTFDQVGSWYESSNKAPLADHNYQPEGQLTILGHTFTLNTFSINQLTQSIFWRPIQAGFLNLWNYSSLDEINSTDYKLDVLNTLASQVAGGRFIFAHILVPHDPYYYNADGSFNLNNGINNLGEPVKQKYINQVQYINGQMEQLSALINKNSGGQAVIIIQSDEGPYPAQLNDEDFNGSVVGSELATGNMLDWSDLNLQMKYGILAAYHIPKASSEALAQGGDSVNIFRLVFNTYFGGNMSYLPRCYYAYPDGRSQPFVYRNINQRLTGSANPTCPADSNFTKKP